MVDNLNNALDDTITVENVVPEGDITATTEFEIDMSEAANDVVNGTNQIILGLSGEYDVTANVSFVIIISISLFSSVSDVKFIFEVTKAPTVSPSTPPTGTPSTGIPTGTPTVSGLIVTGSFSSTVDQSLTEDEINDIKSNIVSSLSILNDDVKLDIGYVASGEFSASIPDDVRTSDVLDKLKASMGNFSPSN